jgi:hypothetical protein
MNLFTVDPAIYMPIDLVEGYQSMIWTERFIEPGEVQVVFPATRLRYERFKPGTLLALSKSRELMLLDTREVKDGMLTVKGRTLEKFFDERPIKNLALTSEPLWFSDGPRRVLGDMVNRIMAGHSHVATQLPRILVETVDPADDSDGGDYSFFGESGYTFGVSIKVEPGPGHEALLNVAKKYNVGMSLVWTKREDGVGYDLVFTTRKGVDRTDPTAPNYVLFSPEMDNFGDIQELVSVANYKNSVIVRRPKALRAAGQIAYYMQDQIVHHYEEIDNPWNVRLAEVYTDDITLDDVTKAANSDAVIAASNGGDLFARQVYALEKMMRAAGHKVLREHRKVNVLDGELPQTPSTQYKYYMDSDSDDSVEYRLGDIVAVGGNFVDAHKAIVTEYVRSVDATGTRSYPTLVPLASPVSEDVGGDINNY